MFHWSLDLIKKSCSVFIVDLFHTDDRHVQVVKRLQDAAQFGLVLYQTAQLSVWGSLPTAHRSNLHACQAVPPRLVEKPLDNNAIHSRTAEIDIGATLSFVIHWIQAPL